jgi:hypothetical protein
MKKRMQWMRWRRRRRRSMMVKTKRRCVMYTK